MSEFLTLVLRETEGGWVWLYTAGMPDEARAERVAELESDAWEHQTEAEGRGVRFGAQFLHRAVLGMPADLSWRLQLGRRGVARRNWLELLIAGLLAVGLFVALPVSALVLLSADGISNRGAALDIIAVIDALFVILLLVLPGILVFDRWPIAGGLLVLIGCLCLMALFWWLREAMVVIVVGAVAAVFSSVRLARMNRA